LPVFNIDPKSKLLCAGQSLEAKASGADTYLWKTNNFNTVLGTDSNVEINFPNSDTLFAILHNNICNITDTLSTIIQVNQLPVVTITKSNDVDCIIQTSKLKATGGSSYVWSPAVDISNINISNPEVYPITDTWYKVNVSDSHGCSSDDSILVHSFVQAKNGAFYVPTAFTPNNDGKNDCFSVKYWGKVDQFELWIYDRAGQIMFHTKNIQECWDGTYNGSLLGTGTYVYQIKASSVCSNGLVYKKGLLNLIR
jgi:gliding motility-associated-like protein